jgi:hypothetical protein
MEKKRSSVDKSLEIERMYDPSKEAVKAALRVVLGWPRVPPPKGGFDHGDDDGEKDGGHL